MRVTVRPQGSITLYGRRELALMEVRIVASATVEKREDTSMVSCTKGARTLTFVVMLVDLSPGILPGNGAPAPLPLSDAFVHRSVPLPHACEDGMWQHYIRIQHARFVNIRQSYTVIFPAAPSLPFNTAQAFSFRLSRLDVRDLFTEGSVFPYLLKIGGGHGGDEDVSPDLNSARAKVG